MEKTLTVFCANEQADTAHNLDISDATGEIIITCGCGRFLKYPNGTDADTLKDLLAVHKEANEGQLSVEALAEQKAKLLDELT